jgi:thioredoxin reductase (NADPH)
MSGKHHPSEKTINQLEPVVEKLIIIGSGPAGFSAAVYAARAELQPILITGIELGGQAALTNTIENYPGFPDGVGGYQLGELLRKQSEKFGAKIVLDTVLEVNLQQRPFLVRTGGNTMLSESLIIATGASPNHLNVPGETELIGKGVSYCATCDGWFFKGKNVAVVGGGDSALEEALFLTRFASHVTIIHRRHEFRAGAILQRRVKDEQKISFEMNKTIVRIIGEDKVRGATILDINSNKSSEIKIDGVFIFVGHTPNTSLFSGQLDIDERGYITIDRTMHTSILGVFAAGEVADPDYRQVVTSAGMGAAAAIQANRFLSK